MALSILLNGINFFIITSNKHKILFSSNNIIPSFFQIYYLNLIS